MKHLCRVAAFVVFAFFVGVAPGGAQQLSLSGAVDDTYGVVPSVPVTLRYTSPVMVPACRARR